MDMMDRFYFAESEFMPEKPSWQLDKQVNDFIKKRELVQVPDFLDFFD